MTRPPAAAAANPEQHARFIDRRLPEVERVRPGLWAIPVPIPTAALRYTFVYAFELPSGIAVIDTGWDDEEAWAGLKNGLATIGADVRDVRDVLVTHAHPDHCGLAGRLQSVGARVGMHAGDARLLRSWYIDVDNRRERTRRQLVAQGAPADMVAQVGGFYRSFENAPPLSRADEMVEDAQALDLPGWTLRAVWTPGHTPGHLCFIEEEHGLLFSGDHLLPRITPIVSKFPEQRPNPLADFVASLERVSGLPIDEVLPAHEYRFHDPAARVEQLVDHHRHRLREVEEAIARTPGTTTWDVAAELSWSRPWDEMPSYQRRMASNETYAHLVHLLEEARVRVDGDDPARWYVGRSSSASAERD